MLKGLENPGDIFTVNSRECIVFKICMISLLTETRSNENVNGSKNTVSGGF